MGGMPTGKALSCDNGKMIIRHDLELVFLHVPKCAGTRLRNLFRLGAAPHAIEELWNFSYNEVLHRYVDLAHLPMSDLYTTNSFKYVERYRVVACIRNPYKRLPSAANEYYRQKSKHHERKVIEEGVTLEMREKYYRKLRLGHNQLDPRFIHSLPIHRFTHFGTQPMVDWLLHCENLRQEARELTKELDLPPAIQDAVEILPESDPAPEPDSKDLAEAEKLYQNDFKWFEYPNYNCRKTSNESTEDSNKVKWIHQAPKVQWHWGPIAEQEEPKNVKSCRKNNNEGDQKRNAKT